MNASHRGPYEPQGLYPAKPRHDFLDACAALTRPCLVNINLTSNHVALRHDESSTYERPCIHIQGLTAIRHGRLKSALM
jgi:hypothetical protein